MIVQVQSHPKGKRLFVLGKRVHHWQYGAAMAAFGLYLFWDDRRDFKLSLGQFL